MEYKNNIEQEPIPAQPEPASGETEDIAGKKYRRIPSGYTVREYFSHHTPEKGPGPGWDYFERRKEELAKRYGIKLNNFRDLMEFNPGDLPDEPYYDLKLIE